MNKFSSAVPIACALVFGGCTIETNPPNVTVILEGAAGSTSAGGSGGSSAAGYAGTSNVGGSAGETSDAAVPETGNEAGSGGASGEGGSAGASNVGGSSGEAGQAGSAGASGEAGSAGSSGAGGQPVVQQLHLSLADNPVSATFVKKEQHAEALGIDVAAPQETIIDSIQLRCQASLGGLPYLTTSCVQRVTSVAIYMDGEQIPGYAKSPDINGDLTFPTNLVIPAGSTKTLVVKMSLASTASSVEPFDKVSFGVTSLTAHVAGADPQYVPTAIDWTLFNDQLSATPHVFQTVRPSGTLSIVAEAMPVSTNVTAGTGDWVWFAQYKATAQYEASDIDAMSVFFCTSPVNGCVADNADYIEVAVASQGQVLGTTPPPVGNDWWARDVYLTKTLGVPKDGSVVFQLWGKLAPVVSYSGNQPVVDGVARSGHAPALGLLSGNISNDWDVNYTGKVDVRTTGLTSGERLYSDVTGSLLGNQMVLRKSVPIITQLPVQTTVLGNHEMELIRFKVQSSGSVGLKHFTFPITKSVGVKLSQFMLYRNGAAFGTPFTYGAEFGNGYDMPADQPSNTLSFTFDGVDVASAVGIEYSLRTTVSGATLGSVVNTLFMISGSDVITGAITSIYPGRIRIGNQPPQTSEPFVWTDMSETLFSAALGSSSVDFTNGKYVEMGNFGTSLYL